MFSRARSCLTAGLLAAALAAAPAMAEGPFRVRLRPLPPGQEPGLGPIGLTTTSCLLFVATYDHVHGAFRGGALLIGNLDGEPTLTPLLLPEEVRAIGDEGGFGHISYARLSATRVLAAHSGADGQSGTGDEGVLLLDDLGGANTVQAIALGTLFSPNVLALDEHTVVVQTDAGASLISDLGGANLVTPIDGVWEPELAVSPTGFIASAASGAVHVKLGAGPPELVPLPSWAWNDALRLAENRLLLTEPGGLRFVPDVNEPDQSTFLPAAGIAYVVRTGPDRAIGRTADAVVMVEGLGGRNRVKTVRVPGMATYGGPVSLGRRSAVVLLTGDTIADYGFAWVRPGPAPVRVALETQTLPIALSPTSVLVASASESGWPEDELMHAFQLGDAPRARTIEVPFAQTYGMWETVLLGNGRAIQVEFVPQYGPIQFLSFLDGIPGGVVLDDVALDVAGPDVSLRAKLALPEPKAFGEADLTLRIGDVQQRIPADAIRRTSRGFRYRDPEGANGFFRLVDFDAKRKRLRAVGRSAEAEAPLGTNRVVSLESSELYAASSGE